MTWIGSLYTTERIWRACAVKQAEREKELQKLPIVCEGRESSGKCIAGCYACWGMEPCLIQKCIRQAFRIVTCIHPAARYEMLAGL
jgi:hypothetical protein